MIKTQSLTSLCSYFKSVGTAQSHRKCFSSFKSTVLTLKSTSTLLIAIKPFSKANYQKAESFILLVNHVRTFVSIGG